MRDPYADVVKTTLDNGVAVYACKWNRPWQKCVFLFHSGAKDDSLPGTAHFVEHLISRNIINRTRRDVERDVEGRGGSINFGRTYISGITFNFRVPIEDFVDVLRIFAGMLAAPRITKYVEDERRIIIHEFHERYASDTAYQLLLQRRRALFGQHWLGQFTSTLGTLDSIFMIDQYVLQDFVDRYFVGANLSIITCGNLAPEQALRAIEASGFAKMPLGQRAPRLPPITVPITPREHGVVVPYTALMPIKPGDSGMECYTALPSQRLRKFGTEDIATRVINEVLFDELRERRHWSYGFYATIANLDAAAECFLGGRLPWESLSSAEDIIDECLERALRNEQEVNRQIRLRQIHWKKMRDLSAGQVINACADQLRTECRLTTAAEDYDELATVRVADIQDILRQLGKSHRFTFVLGE